MKNQKIRDLLKSNIIKLIKEHKERCNTEDCGISTNMAIEVAKMAGLEFTQKEFEECM